MDQKKIPQNPYLPPSQPPESPLTYLCKRSFPSENHPQTPLITRTSDEEIESEFSRLNLSQDYQPHVQTPSFIGVAGRPHGVVPSALREKQQATFWGQNQGINGGVNGLVAPPLNVTVGPGELRFFGGGPVIDPTQKSMSYQGQEFGGGDDDYYSLHGKQTLTRRPNGHFPNLPSSLTNNVHGFPDNSVSGLYNNQLLYQLQQELALRNMRGNLVSLANDPVGSGALNLKLDEWSSSEEIEMVLPEVLEYLSDLMMNQFGSHYIQKLFAMCNEDQKTRIIMALSKFPLKLVYICLDSYGARTVQKLMEKLIMPHQISFLVSALSYGVYALATDSNGQHVIKYCVKHFHGEYTRHLFNEIAENCFGLATNKSGCCVLQSCVEHARGEARDLLIGQIIANAVPLAEDPYGNYVVQHLLEMRRPEVTAELLRQFRGYFVSMSCNKYASNVVEKFFSESGENHSARIIMELLRSPRASMLLLDPYGNFVIQSALSESKGHVHDALLNLIQANASSMQTNLYGKKILAWFEKRNSDDA